jgi:hypothetical protein
MRNTDIEEILINMGDAGCSDADIERVRSMHEAGLDDEIVSCLRRCRCDLMEELHRSQRRVDCMDQLIRAAQNEL